MEVVEESSVALGGLLCFLLGEIDKVRAVWEDVAVVLFVSILSKTPRGQLGNYLAASYL